MNIWKQLRNPYGHTSVNNTNITKKCDVKQCYGQRNPNPPHLLLHVSVDLVLVLLHLLLEVLQGFLCLHSLFLGQLLLFQHLPFLVPGTQHSSHFLLLSPTLKPTTSHLLWFPSLPACLQLLNPQHPIYWIWLEATLLSSHQSGMQNVPWAFLIWGGQACQICEVRFLSSIWLC